MPTRFGLWQMVNTGAPAELFAVWAGATEADAITLKGWMQQRPHQHGSHNFLGFHDDDDADECESVVDWQRDYRGEMAAAGLAFSPGGTGQVATNGQLMQQAQPSD